MLRLLLLSSLAIACRAAEAPVSPSPTPMAESRGTAMPESLRCRLAEDCAPEPSCYWSEPKCVAVATIVTQQCGSDADPKDSAARAVTCGCQAGQCVPVGSP